MMKLSDINPHVRFASIIRRTPRADVMSRNYDCRLFYVISGAGTLTVEKYEHKFSQNYAIFLPPESRYRIDADTDELEMCAVNFDLVSTYSHLEMSLGTASDDSFDAERVPRYELPEEFSHVNVSHSREMHKMLMRCCDELRRGERYCREVVSALIKLCLIELMRESTFDRATSRIADAAIAYIQSNYGDPELSNGMIAARLGYHPYYLSHVMKTVTGKTLRSYITDYRLRIARELLVTTELEISVIAWKCGFNSAAYFTKLFREETGITPRAYRAASGVL